MFFIDKIFIQTSLFFEKTGRWGRGLASLLFGIWLGNLLIIANKIYYNYSNTYILSFNNYGDTATNKLFVFIPLFVLCSLLFFIIYNSKRVKKLRSNYYKTYGNKISYLNGALCVIFYLVPAIYMILTATRV